MDIGKAGKTGKNKGFRLGQEPGGVPIDQDGLAISAHAMTEEELEEQKSGKKNDSKKDLTIKEMVTAEVVAQAVLSREDSLYDLKLYIPEMAAVVKPGQFVSLYTEDASRILPRPISVCEADDKTGIIRLIYRAGGEKTGTAQFTKLRTGDRIRVLGVLGNGFDLTNVPGKHVYVIGGGIGIFPLYELARQVSTLVKKMGAEKQSLTCDVILGYRNRRFFEEEFDAIATESEDLNLVVNRDQKGNYVRVQVATEDGSAGVQGNVLDVMAELENSGSTYPAEECVIYACGPKPMLRALKAYAEERGIECYISLEERMACGIGACLACVCDTKEVDEHSQVHNTRICTDGPVFNAKEVIL